MGRGGERLARQENRPGPRTTQLVREKKSASGIDNQSRPIPLRVTIVWTILYLPITLVCFTLIVIACFANTALEAVDYAWRGPEDGEDFEIDATPPPPPPVQRRRRASTSSCRARATASSSRWA